MAGFRIYFAETLIPRPAPGRPISIKDRLHVIIVPLDANGEEIQTDSDGLQAIYNYNNDCPYNCPEPPNGIPRLMKPPHYDDYLAVQREGARSGAPTAKK